MRLSSLKIHDKKGLVDDILSSVLEEGGSNSKVTLTLSPNCIAYQSKQGGQVMIPLAHSNLRFRMLLTNRQLHGFQLKSNDQQPVSFFSSDVLTLTMWQKQLSNLLYQEGFHSMYKTLKRLGKGTFSTVYLAQRFTDKKLFAVKNFTKTSGSAKSVEEKWLRSELSVMRGLDHPCIVKLESVFQEVNNILAVVEYAEGKSLDCYCNGSYNKLQEAEVISISRQLMEALAHMDSHNIVHRDLKPENVILRPGLKPIIIDFGFAVNSTDIPKELKNACGTPGFIAPQIYKQQPLVFGSFNDVYSLGAIIYNLLHGPLYMGTSLKEIMDKNKTSNVPKHLKHSDSPLDRLVYEMLQKQPKSRISVLDSLQHFCFKDDREPVQSKVDYLHS